MEIGILLSELTVLPLLGLQEKHFLSKLVYITEVVFFHNTTFASSLC